MNEQTGLNHSTDSNGQTFAEVLRDTTQFLWKCRWRILAYGFLFASIAFYMTTRMDRLYKSSVQLMIERPATSPIEIGKSGLVLPDTGYVDGQILLIESDDTLSRVITKLDLLDEPGFQSQQPGLFTQSVRWVKSTLSATPQTNTPLPANVPDKKTLSALKILREAVFVSREGDTNVVSIDVRTVSPRLAHTIADTLAGVYTEIRLEQRQAQARELSGWIDARAGELRAQVTQAEAAVTQFRIDNNLIGEFDGPTLGDQRLVELNAELIRSRAELAQKMASFELAKGVLAGNTDASSIPEVQNSVIYTALREQQLEQQRRAQEATLLSSSDNPRVNQILRRLAAIEDQMTGEIARITEVLANETETLQSRIRLLQAEVAKASQQSEVETRSQAELRDLERIAEAYRQRHERYLNNAGIATELSTFASSGTQIISAATWPLLPFYPPTKVLVILSFLLGAAIAVVQSLLRDILRPKFTSIAQVKRDLGMEVLSVMPTLEKGQSVQDVINEEPFSLFTDATSVLRQNIQSKSVARRSGETPVVLITSACETEGKTSIAAALATSASSSGQKVLLVDTDLRYAGLSEIYKLDDQEGLCEILQGQSWTPVKADDSSILDIVPAGKLHGRQPSDLLSGPQLRNFIATARAHYDLVVLDSPPVAHLADTAILADRSTDIALVLQLNSTSVEAVRSTIQRLPRRRIAGAIVNAVSPSDQAGIWSSAGVYAATYKQSAKLYQLHNTDHGVQNPDRRETS